MTQTFEEYLTDKHASQYVGIDDDMGEDYGDWLAGLDIQEIIDYAVKWHKKEMIREIEDLRKSLLMAIEAKEAEKNAKQD